MSGLGLVWSKAEGSNCAHSSSNQNFTHGGLLSKEGLRALANRYLILHLIHDACVRGFFELCKRSEEDPWLDNEVRGRAGATAPGEAYPDASTRPRRLTIEFPNPIEV
jgi:hypothetical protein